MSQALCFNDVSFEIVDRENQPWVRVSQIATALGYKAVQRVTELYTRHADEFTPSMTSVVTLPTEGGPQDIRIFSLRGCHLLAMFARTPVAKSFRQWVLDVLEKMQPQPQLSLAISTTADRRPLEKLVKVWASQARMPHAQAWTQVNAHFNLGSITELPVNWLPDAIAFVEAKIDALPKALPASDPQPHLFDQLRLSPWDKVQMGQQVRAMLESGNVGQHTMECVLLKARYVSAIDDVYRLCNQLYADLQRAARAPYAAARKNVNTSGHVWADSFVETLYADQYRIIELGKEFHCVAFRALNSGICVSKMVGM